MSSQNRVDFGSCVADSNYGHEGDQAGQQRILDEVLAFVVTQQRTETGNHIQHDVPPRVVAADAQFNESITATTHREAAIARRYSATDMPLLGFATSGVTASSLDERT